MDRKIYEDYKKNNWSIALKENHDLKIIFDKMGLKSLTDVKDSTLLNEINSYTDNIMKYGIRVGIGIGKNAIISNIQSNSLTKEEIDTINTETYGKKTIITPHLQGMFVEDTPKNRNRRKHKDKDELWADRLIDKDEARYLSELFEKINIKWKDYEKLCETVLKLNPKSSELPLSSNLYKNEKRMYRADTLIDIHYRHFFKQGIAIGFNNGKKISIEDIQNKKHTIEEIKKMDKTEIGKYMTENLSKIDLME